MLCNIFFKAYRYKKRAFCIKLFGTKTLKTSNIPGNNDGNNDSNNNGNDNNN